MRRSIFNRIRKIVVLEAVSFENDSAANDDGIVPEKTFQYGLCSLIFDDPSALSRGFGLTV